MAPPQLAGTGFQALFHSPPGVLFTFPSQYSALSVTKRYLALRGGPRAFPQGSSCPVVLRILPRHPGFAYGALTLSGRPSQAVPLPSMVAYAVHTPRRTRRGLGSSPSARRYSGNHFCFPFLRLLRCFSSPGSLPMAMCSPWGAWALPMRVPPFRHPRIFGYLPLPAAFRSLSRLSSALSAKASALCLPLLNLHAPCLAWHGSCSSVQPCCTRSCFVALFCFFPTYDVFFLVFMVLSIRFSRCIHAAPHGASGLKWTRTIDLTLIRRAL